VWLRVGAAGAHRMASSSGRGRAASRHGRCTQQASTSCRCPAHPWMARALGRGGDGAPMGEQREGQRGRGGRRQRLEDSGAGLGSCAGQRKDGSLGGGKSVGDSPRGPLKQRGNPRLIPQPHRNTLSLIMQVTNHAGHGPRRDPDGPPRQPF
jgi:hypothetical protein